MPLFNFNTPLRPYSVKELSGLYKVSEKTVRRWLVPFQAEIGKRVGWYYNARQVLVIFRRLGLPGVAGDEEAI
jgi:transposase